MTTLPKINMGLKINKWMCADGITFLCFSLFSGFLIMSSDNVYIVHNDLINAIKYGYSKRVVSQLIEKFIELSASFATRYIHVNAVKLLQDNTLVSIVESVCPTILKNKNKLFLLRRIYWSEVQSKIMTQHRRYLKKQIQSTIGKR